MTESLLDDITQRIVGAFNPEKIILFGSQAQGSATADSDIDLLVVMATNAPPHKRSVPIRKALRGVGIAKDIIVKTPDEFERFKDVIGTIVFPAAHHGRVLYERR